MSRRVLVWLLGAIAAAPLMAHDFRLTDTLLLLKSNGTFVAEMTVDLDALALGASSETDSETLATRLGAMPAEELEETLDGLRRLLERRVRIRFDGRPAPFTVSFPDRGTVDAAAPPSFLGTTARLAGAIPEGAGEVSFFASRGFPPIHLTILEPGTLAGARRILEAGERSEPYRLGQTTRPALSSGTVARYLWLGFRHIVPDGADHILFVLGLFLLTIRWRPLLWQVSSFTAAHTLTLALSVYGVVSLSPRVVEPLIALSIAWVAIENVLTTELKPWRPALVFAFGLLHGLGFAGAIAELSLPAGEQLVALVAFNGGVELGQLTVLAAAFLLVGWYARRPAYRRRLAVPLSVVIGAVGLYWFIERISGP